MAVTEGIWSPDDGTDYDPPVDLAAMAASIAARITATMVPTGSVLAFGGAAAPAGWLLCQGQAVSRATYAALFAVVGTTYGAGDGSATFNVPNLKGRVPVGVDAGQTEFTPAGKTGGAKTHTLTANELAMHGHTYGADDMIGTQGGYARRGSFPYDATSTFTGGGGHFATAGMFEGSNVGGGEVSGGAAHNNLQPYLATNFIIKAA